MVGFSLSLNNVGPVLKAVRRIRSMGLNSHITLGGHHATFNYPEILADNPGIDSIVRGEGEATSLELANRLTSSQDWHNIANLAFRNGNGIVSANPCRPLIQDLDLLPFPWRKPYSQFLHEHGIASMVSSRGCYANCGFCSIRAFYKLSAGVPWRMRTPENVVAEIKSLVRSYGVKHVIFLDDNFMGPGQLGKRRARAIAAEITSRSLNINFTLACRPNDMEFSTLKALQDAGLIRVDLGIESFVPRQLALYNKGLTVEQNERAIKILKDLGLEYRLYLITADPYVTIDELLQNLAHIEREGIDHMPHAFANRLLAFKGTSLTEQMIEEGLVRSTPGERQYIGALNYDFQQPLINEVMDSLDRLDQELRQAIEKVKQVLPRTNANLAETSFSREIVIALNDYTLELSRRILLFYRDDQGSKAGALLKKGSREMAQSIENVEAAKLSGELSRFESVRFSLGQRSVIYPPADIRTLSEEIFRVLSKAG